MGDVKEVELTLDRLFHHTLSRKPDEGEGGDHSLRSHGQQDLMATVQDLLTLEGYVSYGKLNWWWTPQKFLRIDDMPMTGTGKIDEKNLRDRVAGR